MHTTNQLLDLLARQSDRFQSDYALAGLLGVVPSAIYNYRAGRSFLSDAMCRKVAAQLNLPAAYVLACVHAEREKDESGRDVWIQIAKKFTPGERHMMRLADVLYNSPGRAADALKTGQPGDLSAARMAIDPPKRRTKIAAASAVLIALGMAGAPSPSDAAPSLGQASGPVYIMLNHK